MKEKKEKSRCEDEGAEGKEKELGWSLGLIWQRKRRLNGVQMCTSKSAAQCQVIGCRLRLHMHTIIYAYDYICMHMQGRRLRCKDRHREAEGAGGQERKQVWEVSASNPGRAHVYAHIYQDARSISRQTQSTLWHCCKTPCRHFQL